jgi:threonine synthase
VREGLSEDGGLYIPKHWPRYSREELRAMADMSYVQLALRLMQPFVQGSVSDGVLAALLQDSYAHFNHAEVTPLIRCTDDLYLLEKKVSNLILP